MCIYININIYIYVDKFISGIYVDLWFICGVLGHWDAHPRSTKIIQDADEAVFDSRVALLIEKLAAVPESKIVGSPESACFFFNMWFFQISLQTSADATVCKSWSVHISCTCFQQWTFNRVVPWRPWDACLFSGRGRPLRPHWKIDQKDGPEGDQFHGIFYHVSPADTQWKKNEEEHHSEIRGCWQLEICWNFARWNLLSFYRAWKRYWNYL